MRIKSTAVILALMLAGCASRETAKKDSASFEKGQFGYDAAFLRKHHADAVLLENGDARVLVLPAYQGRVMTSAAQGDKGRSFGWINYDLIDSQKSAQHMNAFGGEDRFWLGPEGGQFSVYFKPGVEFTFENWFVPKEIDTEPFTLIKSTATEATFEKQMRLQNYSGHDFDLKVDRTIRLLSNAEIGQSIGMDIPASVATVGFESGNSITNTGDREWRRDSGALSIWILGMFNASDSARVVIPFAKGEEDVLGKIVTDDYFGKVPADRLVVKDGYLVFAADGKFRSKIGLSPTRARRLIGSYDALSGLLTIVDITLPDSPGEYVNSQWTLQDNPFNGDVINSYNDGPVADGSQMGNFYELESSSPAAFLKPGERIVHRHRTMHFQGTKTDLDDICRQALGVGLGDLSLKVEKLKG